MILRYCSSDYDRVSLVCKQFNLSLQQHHIEYVSCFYSFNHCLIIIINSTPKEYQASYGIKSFDERYTILQQAINRPVTNPLDFFHYYSDDDKEFVSECLFNFCSVCDKTMI